MQLGDLDAEALHCPQHQLGKQAHPVSIEEPGQAAPHPVVVEQRRLAGAEVKQGGVEGSGPFTQGVHRAGG